MSSWLQSLCSPPAHPEPVPSLRAHRDRVVRVRGAVVGEHSLLVAERDRRRVRDEEAGGLRGRPPCAPARAPSSAAFARSPASGSPTLSKYAFDVLVLLRGRAPASPPGSSGASLASFSDCSTARAQRLVGQSFDGHDCVLLPERALDRDGEVVAPPAVDIWLSANRTLAEYPPPMLTWMLSALDIFTMRSTSAFASSRERTRRRPFVDRAVRITQSMRERST